MNNTSNFCYRYYTRRETVGTVGPEIHNARDAAAFAKKAVFNNPEDNWRERSVAIYADKAKHVIGYEVLSEGGPSACMLDPKQVCRTAIENMADSVVHVHNHPDGDVKPSVSDISSIALLNKALKSLGISLLDAVILSDREVYSFTDEVKYKC